MAIRIWSILLLLIFIVIYASIIIHIFASRARDHIQNNWTEHRENPLLVPFAGLFRQDGDKRSFTESTKQNFTGWLWALGKNIFSVLMKPIHYVFTLITKIIAKFMAILNTLRQQAMAMRNMFSSIVGQVAEKMANTSAAVKYYQAKMVDIMKRQKAVFQLTLYLSKAMKLTFDSLTSGPLLGLAKFFPLFGILLLVNIALCIICFAGIPFVSWVVCPICAVNMASVAAVAICFDSHTPVTLMSGEVKPIVDLRLGESVKGGGRITSTLAFEIRGRHCPVYRYRDVTVSGSHLVYGAVHEVCRIQDCPEAQLLEETPDTLHCLITEGHRIHSNGVDFADFYETACPSTIRESLLLVENALRDPKDAYASTSLRHLYAWGVAKDTLVHMWDGTMKSIQDVMLGDRVYDPGNKSGTLVYGTICHDPQEITIYTYQGIHLSGTQLVHHHNRWKRAYRVGLEHKRENVHPLYSIATESHQYTVCRGDTVIHVRDYMEINEDDPVMDRIHKLNLASLT